MTSKSVQYRDKQQDRKGIIVCFVSFEFVSVSPEACLGQSEALIRTDSGWLSLVISLLRVAMVLIRTSLKCFKMTSNSVQDRNKQQGREEALFDQK